MLFVDLGEALFLPGCYYISNEVQKNDLYLFFYIRCYNSVT